MPSSRPEPRSTEEYLRSRRRQLKRRIDSSPKGCIPALCRAITRMWIVFFFLILAAWATNTLWERYSMVLPHVKQIAPGMTEAEVRALFPRRMTLTSRETDRLLHATHLVPDSQPATHELEVRSLRTPSSLDFLLFLLGSDWDAATIYFDSSDRLTGLSYNAYHNRWEPAWGVPFEEKCDEPGAGEKGGGIKVEGEP